MSRKIYTKEVKEQAVKLSYRSGNSVAESALDFGQPQGDTVGGKKSS
jgi:transposase-like protein